MRQYCRNSTKSGTEFYLRIFFNPKLLMAGFLVNDRKVDIPSYQANQADTISVAPSSKKNAEIKMAAENAAAGQLPAWLQVDHDTLKGAVLQLPTRADIDIEIQEQLIVELYSR